MQSLPRDPTSWRQYDCFRSSLNKVMEDYTNKTAGQGPLPAGPDFGERHLWIWLTLGPMLVLLALIYAHDIWWRGVMQGRAKHVEEEKEVDEIASQLLRTLTPSVAVESYQFRGMWKKNAPISIGFEKLGLVLKNGRSVLDGVTGQFEAGCLAAIMGPSGAGKSTFMNVLCGKATYGSMTGRVCINGEEKDIAEFKPVTGFVPQDDVVHEQLTVREQLRYSSELRGQIGTPAHVHCAIVDDVLQVMQIAHIQESIVGSVQQRGISGGQRKRVNIGLELAACPVLLFLDEPTSGLDSTSSLMIIGSLKKMTQLGMTIVMVIHQPRYSLFTLFDTVLLLGQGGSTVFLGHSGDAVPYFEGLGFERPASDNPADWIMDVLSGEVSSSKQEQAERKSGFLFSEWAVHKGRASEQEGAAVATEHEDGTEAAQMASTSTKRPSGRTWTEADDKRVIAEMLENEWDKVDKNTDGALGVDEMQEVLGNCLGSPPSRGLVKRLVQRILGREGTVRREEFVDYVVGACRLVLEESRQGASDGHLHELLATAGGAADWAMGAGGSPKEGQSDLQRVTPGWFRQFRVIFHRSLVQFWRQTVRRTIDNGLIVVCALIAAIMHQDDTAAPASIVVFHLGLALLTSVSCLKTFADRPIFWRERARGINVFSFFTARLALDFVDVLLQTILYTSIYFFVTQPRIHFGTYFLPCLMLSCVSSGWGYLLSTLMSPSNATTASVILMLILCGILGAPGYVKDAIDGGVGEVVCTISPVRWSMQMFLLRYHEDTGGLRYPPALKECQGLSEDERLRRGEAHMKETSAVKILEELDGSFRKGALVPSLGYWGSGVLVLGLEALLLYILGYLALRFANRAKQI